MIYRRYRRSLLVGPAASSMMVSGRSCRSARPKRRPSCPTVSKAISAAVIRQRRQQLNLTQAEVADKLGVTADCITLAELGYRRLDLDRMQALADALNLNRRQLCRAGSPGARFQNSTGRLFQAARPLDQHQTNVLYIEDML